MQYTFLTSMQNSQYFIVVRLFRIKKNDCSSETFDDIKGIIRSWKKMSKVWYCNAIKLSWTTGSPCRRLYGSWTIACTYVWNQIYNIIWLRSQDFCVEFYWPLCVLLSFFVWLLCCRPFFINVYWLPLWHLHTNQ